MKTHSKIINIEDYEPYIGGESVERIIRKAKYLKDYHVIHVNSTYYGGGVAELLSPLMKSIARTYQYLSFSFYRRLILFR